MARSAGSWRVDTRGLGADVRLAGLDPDPANADLIRDWSTRYWKALHPYSAGGAHVNMFMDEGQERVQAAYSENYERLSRTKTRYDPANLFHINHNVRPG